jgi:hypothetical protein
MAQATLAPSDSAQKAMETLTAQWYNAVIEGCSLDKSNFQLFQGNGAIGSTSEILWNIFDVVPPASASHYYNPSQANVFSSDYGAVVNNLVPQNANAFQNDMGDYYAKWEAYLGTNPKIPDGGILALFQQWSELHMPPDQAQTCYTDYQEVSQGVVPVAVQMWLAAGGAGAQKAYNATIAQLNSALQGVRGADVTMDSATESSDVTDTWAKGEVGGWYDIFAGQAGGEWDDFTTSVTKAGLEVQATFTRLLTFTAGPLAKKSEDPILSDYKPWYWEPALNLAYQNDNNLVWKKTPPTWDNTFGPKGNLQRTTSALVVVDGVDISVKSTASFDSAQQREVKANAEAGFWPFFEVSVSGGWENDVEFDDHGAITMTSKSPTGNPQILGAIVTPISESLSGAQS